MMTMPLSGCMDNSDESTSEEENFELQDWHVHFAVNAADLPTCNEDTNGRLYYVESDNEFQVCKSTGWEIISIKGTDGVDGNNGDKGDQGIPGTDGKTTLVNILSSTNCENDGYKFEIGTDANNDGVLTSDEVTLTTEVCNGKNGIDGADGQDGAPGLDGTDGVDGVQGPMGPQGPQGPAGNDGTNGVDGQDGAPGADGAQGPQGPAGNDGADGADGQDGAPGADGAQGPQGPSGNDGADGADGSDGYDIRVNTNTVSPGDTDCTDGGIEIEIGADTNDNGVLDQNEISTIEKICNGEGRNSMVSTSTILSGDIDCPDGGTELAIGVDYDDNGILDSWEVGTYEKICNGEGRDSMVSTSTISSGDIDCPDGGTELAIGVDYNDNGVLDSSEVGTYEKVCNGVAGSDGQNGVNGVNGADGTDGYDSLISSSSEPAGSNCASGGHKMEIGSDLNRDGQMDANEVANTLYICDGNDGVAVSIPWVDITGVPSDIADGDNDTTYSGIDFAKSGQTCGAVDANGNPYYAHEIDMIGDLGCAPLPTYDGSDFAISGNSCSNGMVMMGISYSGNPICVIDNDTTVSGNCPTGDYFMYGISQSGLVLCSLTDTYDGYDFAVSNQQCSTGTVMRGIASNGLMICAVDETLPTGYCSTGYYMYGISNSGVNCNPIRNYDGYDFAESNQYCSSNQLMRGISNSGQIVCVHDSDTTYSGFDFAVSDQYCSYGTVVIGISYSGTVVCYADSDTNYDGNDFVISGQTCPSGQVVGAVSTNGLLVCNALQFETESTPGSPSTTPAAGTAIFNTGDNKLYVYDGMGWKSVQLS